MAGPGGREVGRVSIRVLPDTTAFGKDLDKYLTRIEQRTRVKIPVEVNETDFVRDVRRLTEGVEKASKLKLPAEAETGAVTAQVQRLVRRLSGKEITLNVDLDAGLARARSGFASLARSMASLSKPVAIANTIPMLLGLGAAAGTASGALALLPATLGAVAIGVGAMKLAFSGFGDAMKNLGDPAKFEEALKGLAPAAQDVARQIRGLRPAFESLRLDVQQKFFAELGTVVADLGRTYLPILQSGLSRVSSAMGDMAAQTGRALMTPQAINSVKVMLDQTAVAFDRLAPAGAAFASALTRIGEVGSSFLPGMASAVTDVANRFNEWTQAAAASGELRSIIESALNVLSQLGTIAGNVFSIITGLFNAVGMSGASALTSIEKLTAGLADFVHSSQGATALGQIFDGISAAMAGIVPALTSVIQALVVNLGPVIEQLGPAVGQLATQIGAVLVTAIRVLSPLLLVLATFLRENMTWLGPLIIGFGTLAVTVGPVVGIVTRLSNAFALLSTIGPKVVQAGLTFANFATKVGAAALRVTASIVSMVARGIAQFTILTVRTLAQVTMWTAQVTARFVAMSARAIASMAAMAARVVARWAFMAAGAMARAAVMAAAWFVAMGPIGWVIAAVVGLVALIIANWDRVKSWTIAAWNAVSGAVAGAWRAVVGFVSNGVSRVVGFVRSLPGQLLSAVSNFGSLLWNAGADLIRGMINGVKSMIGNLLGTVRDMASSAVSTVKSWLGIGSPSKVFADLGEWTGEGFAKGIKNGTPVAVDAATGMARAVAATPVSPPAAPGATGGTSDIEAAVTAGVLAGLHGAKMRVEGDGVARLVNRTNAANARR